MIPLPGCQALRKFLSHLRPGLLPMSVALMFLWSVSAGACAEPDLDPSKAVRSINGKWWNHDTNSYNPPSANSYYDNQLRKDGRLSEIAETPKWDWNLNFSWLGEVLTYVIISVLVLLLTVGLVLIIMHIVRTYRPVRDSNDYLGSEIKIDPARIEELPFDAVQWVGDPLAEARKLAQQGRFDQAIIYLYGYQLLALDQSRRIHLHKGKTNRMYLREIEPLVQLKEIVDLTMGKFEEVYFGKHSLSKQSFLEVWNKLDDFHSLLSQSLTHPGSDQMPTEMGVAT